MSEKIAALDYLDELISIHTDSSLSVKTKYPLLRQLLEKVSKDLTSHETINFADLFSRLSYICTGFKTSRNIHGLRTAANQLLHHQIIPSEETYRYHVAVFAKFLQDTYGIAVPADLLEAERPAETYRSPSELLFPEARVSVVEIKENILICQLDQNSIALDMKIPEDQLIVVQINALGFNDEFASVANFWVGATLYLLNIMIDADQIFHPKYLILEPDYLVDVSAISECLQDYGHSELLYLKSKFEKVANSKHILLGNFANLVVDELFSGAEENVSFKTTFIKHFKSNPFEYTTCEDIASASDFTLFQQDCQRHFNTIKQVIHNDFPELNIDIENASLEPSFISEKYGIQGRLDILDRRNKTEAISKIIELKSGGTVFPDDGKSIKNNHQSQLFLYYLLISQAENIDISKLNNFLQGYILYSKADQGNLRGQAPYERGFQQILEVRNRIIILEHLLAEDNLEKTGQILSMVNPVNIINKEIHKNFRIRIEPQIHAFLNPYLQSSALAQKYFRSFVNYVAYEHYLSKVGSNEREKENSNNGLAGLWLNSFEEKDKKFEILYDLTIEENKIDEEEQIIRFKRTNPGNKHANFRTGDICVLYPRNKETDIVSKNRLFKCTIQSITKEYVTVYFRYRQRNKSYFESFGEEGKWAVERDFMESSFNSMYKNLYEFLNAKKIFADLLLLQKFPAASRDYGYKNKGISFEQERVINKALSADHYFLLNGPPGTGKTSIVIKNLVKELMETEKNVLVLAYTNRAVDELCEAVNAAAGSPERINFIRFGSRLSSSPEHHKNLLSEVINRREEKLKSDGKRLSRLEIEKLLAENMIYISTVASISSRDQIFKIKDFDYIIVDEASQILEPQIIGTLSKVPKFILIGDHKQLPAISLQNSDRSLTNDSDLENMGLQNRKNSLFERLFRFCENHKLLHAIDSLSYQGRMHQEIALFPNFAFYGGKLVEAYHTPNLDPNVKNALFRQVNTMNFTENSGASLRNLLANKRLIFFNNKQSDDLYAKFNEYEADLVVKIVKEVQALYQSNQKVFSPKESLGIIAPFRNQIAIIKQKLEEAEIPGYEEITVDSVERFQGSQRDIIIYSFSINNPFQLNGMVSLNDEGDVDRKLNVALTRSKEQLILIGNDSILSANIIYLRLIEYCKSKEGYIDIPVKEILAEDLLGLPTNGKPLEEDVEIQWDHSFDSAFKALVLDKIMADRRTEWPEKILGAGKDFTRNNIICYGLADFDETLNLDVHQNFKYGGSLDQLFLEYTPQDKVQLYCYWNMRKHYASSQYVFRTHFDYFSAEIKKLGNKVVFIDFGCGPLTAALAFSTLFKDEVQDSIHYIGVDSSTAMLEKAMTFSRSECFRLHDTFDFVKDFSQINKKRLENRFSSPSVVVFNCSYVLSGLDSKAIASLAEQITRFMIEYSFNKYMLVFQNPVNRDQQMRKLLAKIKLLNRSVFSGKAGIYYKDNDLDGYAKNEHLMYEVVSN
ncbi:AAA domain-containing protein [Chryseobacterium sp. MYb264]|uniref:AAA domain-containing protein n=1 Tax=Chryseobacterium sp. MYb264 TaxID=2745153 RepID=UPI002E0DEBC4|nr:AAA domain-containing protein [Chryseobacterium sp. MYb264]